MPAPRQHRRLYVTPLLALTLFACGEAAEPAPASPRATRLDPVSPFGDIPRQELYGASPADNIWSPRVELEVLDLPRGWDGARFAIISDFQLGRWDDNERVAAAAVGKALSERADVVLLLGDFVSEGTDLAPLERVLAPLRGRRALAVLGVGDMRSDSLEARITRALQAVGVQVLTNGSAQLVRNGDAILLAGIDASMLARTWADQQYVLATLGEPARTPILLTYAPPLATRAPMGRFPIIIGGNTFCGIVEVPGTPRLSWLQSQAFPNAAIAGSNRLFRVQGSTVLVACGIGYGYVPTRFGSAPEVPILTIVRGGAAEPDVDAAAADSLTQALEDEAPPAAPDTP